LPLLAEIILRVGGDNASGDICYCGNLILDLRGRQALPARIRAVGPCRRPARAIRAVSASPFLCPGPLWASARPSCVLLDSVSSVGLHGQALGFASAGLPLTTSTHFGTSLARVAGSKKFMELGLPGNSTWRPYSGCAAAMARGPRGGFRGFSGI
jgi:hypothetical protein